MKHTKGPWGWQKFGSYDSLTAQHGMREIIIGSVTTESGLSSFVAMNKDGILNPIDRDHANAKLIAKAPEMIEALKDMINIFDTCGYVDVEPEKGNINVRISKAKSLIKELS
jgi:hypothetical protein